MRTFLFIYIGNILVLITVTDYMKPYCAYDGPRNKIVFIVDTRESSK